MFSGIIQEIGCIVGSTHHGGGARLCIETATPCSARPGSSVAVSGVCLTVSQKKGRRMWFDVMAESVAKTTIGSWEKGDIVNVEPSLRLGDEVGGHFVFGHVDTIGKIALPRRVRLGRKRLQDVKTSRMLTIALPKKWMRYVVPQGSVAIDGVSLTVARVGRTDFTVSLVDFTLDHTTLRNLKKGDRVNVECDMLAKYAATHINMFHVHVHKAYDKGCSP